MKAVLVLAAVVLINAALAFLALGPGLVTYAEVPVKSVSCGLCANPEVQAALIRAASHGRLQIQSGIVSHMWVVASLCLANVVVVITILVKAERRGEIAV